MRTIWQDKLAALEAKGWSVTAIAKAINAPQSTISELKQGRSKEPRWTMATRLNELHAKECGNATPAKKRAA